MTDLLWFWKHADKAVRFQTGVCLHGHTMHSEECLGFAPRILGKVPGVSRVLARYDRVQANCERAYWTPPLPPAAALKLERDQISAIGLRPLVSLTDHDNIEAGISLQATEDRRETPVSVEWTVPYRGTILHIGVHNLPRRAETRWMSAMAAYTASPDESRLPGLLREFANNPAVLLALNHPLWLEEGITRASHDRALPMFLRECIEWIHAIELNGTREWQENATTIRLAREYSRPVISGGDRHGCEPAACLNLTNARSFEEFVSEIRDGESTLLVMPQYRDPMALRLFEAGWDVLRPYPEYRGRERWMDRFFYRGEDGVARPLSVVWKKESPWMLNPATSVLQVIASAPLRPALRLLLASHAEVLP